MLRRTAIFLVTSFFASAALAAVSVGATAPAFTAIDAVTGKTFSSESLKGKTVVIEWNNFECPFIKKFYSVGTMQALQANAIKDGVVWVSVNSSAEGKEGYLKDAKEAKTALTERKSNASHYLLDHDGKIGHAFGAKTTPHMFVIDKEGKLVYQGAIDNKPTADTADIAMATNYVTLALKSVSAGKPIETNTTRPYGCFVKY